MFDDDTLEERIDYIKKLGYTFPENLVRKILEAEKIYCNASSYLFHIEDNIGSLNGIKDEEYIKMQKKYIQKCINSGFIFKI